MTHDIDVNWFDVSGVDRTTTMYRNRPRYRSIYNKPRTLVIGDLQALVKENDLIELSDAALVEEWKRCDSAFGQEAILDDRDDILQRLADIEAEWERRHGPLQQALSIRVAAKPTVADVMRITGLSRSAASHRLRLGLSLDLLLAKGRIPRGKYESPDVAKRHYGKQIPKYHLYQIAKAAADVFNPHLDAARKMMRLRDALEAAGVLSEEDASWE